MKTLDYASTRRGPLPPVGMTERQSAHVREQIRAIARAAQTDLNIKVNARVEEIKNTWKADRKRAMKTHRGEVSGIKRDFRALQKRTKRYYAATGFSLAHMDWQGPGSSRRWRDDFISVPQEVYTGFDLPRVEARKAINMEQNRLINGLMLKTETRAGGDIINTFQAFCTLAISNAASFKPKRSKKRNGR